MPGGVASATSKPKFVVLAFVTGPSVVESLTLDVDGPISSPPDHVYFSDEPGTPVLCTREGCTWLGGGVPIVGAKKRIEGSFEQGGSVDCGPTWLQTVTVELRWEGTRKVDGIRVPKELRGMLTIDQPLVEIPGGYCTGLHEVAEVDTELQVLGKKYQEAVCAVPGVREIVAC